MAISLPCIDGGTDHRLSWSVTQGLRPAKFHENLRRQEAVNLRSIFAFPSSLVFKGLRCFFDPVIPRNTTRPSGSRFVTDDTSRSAISRLSAYSLDAARSGCQRVAPQLFPYSLVGGQKIINDPLRFGRV